MLRPLLILLCLGTAVLIHVDSSSGQDAGLKSKKTTLAKMPLHNVRLQNENIASFFSEFSLTYDIPLGLEIARGGDEQSFYSIDFKEGTLSDLLAQFVNEHKEYAWAVENGVVSVFPKEDYRDPLLRKILKTAIRSFSLPKKTSSQAFGKSLLSTPEIKEILEPYGLTFDTGYLGGFYIQQLGQQYSFDVTRMETKSILDKAIKESPVARNWIIGNSLSERKLFLRINARPESTAENPSEHSESTLNGR